MSECRACYPINLLFSVRKETLDELKELVPHTVDLVGELELVLVRLQVLQRILQQLVNKFLYGNKIERKKKQNLMCNNIESKTKKIELN